MVLPKPVNKLEKSDIYIGGCRMTCLDFFLTKGHL